MPEPISPELALIDPALQSAPIGTAPPLEAQIARVKPSRPIAHLFDCLPAHEGSRRVSLPVEAAAYTEGAIIRVAFFDLSVALFLGVLIAVVNVVR